MAIPTLAQDRQDEDDSKTDDGPCEAKRSEQDAQPRVVAPKLELVQGEDEHGEQEDQAL